MIKEEIKKYPLDYAILFIGLISFLLVFVQFFHLPKAQKPILAATVAFYFFWGILHHLLRNHLNLRIVLEYLIFCLFGFIVTTIILRLL